jgi:hypothetical protein
VSTKTTSTTPTRVLLALTSLALAALAATAIGAQTGGCPLAPIASRNIRSLRERGDIRFLPAPLQNRLLELPLTAFSEAAEPSRLLGYYLLDTTGFPPNVLTSIRCRHQ